MTVHWEKITQEVLGTGSELTLIARDSECPDGLLVRVGTCGNQVINRALTKVQLIRGQLGLWTHMVILSPDPEYMIGIDSVHFE